MWKPIQLRTCFLLLLLTSPRSLAATLKEYRSYAVVQLSDLVLSASGSWQDKVHFKAACQLFCARNTLCVAFTYLPQSPNGRCRMYWAVPSVSDQTSVTSAGAMTYVLIRTSDIVEQPAVSTTQVSSGSCVKQTDCIQQMGKNTLCLSSQCHCAVGYVFSYTSKTCVSECSKFYQHRYTLLIRSCPDIYQSPIYVLFTKQTLSVVECSNLCSAKPTCQAVCFFIDSFRCQGFEASAIRRAETFKTVWSGIYKQKLCY